MQNEDVEVRPLNHPSHLEYERLIELAKTLSGEAAREMQVMAALQEAHAAAAVAADLPRWRVRLWISCVERARMADCPALAARMAKKHLTRVKLRASNLYKWLNGVLKDGAGEIESVGSLSAAEIEAALDKACEGMYPDLASEP